MASIYEQVELGSFEGVIELLRAGDDPNWRPEGAEFQSPLALAAARGYRDIVIALSGNADTDLNGPICSPLKAAAENGHADVVDVLIKAGCPVTTNAVLSAIYGLKPSSLDIVRMLVASGAEINPQDDNFPPVLAAARSGNCAVLKWLLENGADAYVRDPEQGRNLLQHAVNAQFPCNIQCLELLLSLRPALDLEELRYSSTIGEDVTVLMRAAMYRYADAVQLLLDAGAQVNARTAGGLTALHLSASFADNFAVFKLLLDRGADVHAVDSQGRTPFHCFCQHGLKLWAEGGDAAAAGLLLLQRGADINCTDNLGRSAVHYLVGLPQCSRDPLWLQGQGPPYAAAVAKHWDNLAAGLDFLNKCGADLAIYNKWRRNALHAALFNARQAIRSGSNFGAGASTALPPVILKLAEAGAQFTVDLKGNTPLGVLMSELFDLSTPYVPPLITVLVAAGDRAWHAIDKGCPGLGGAILPVWTSTPEQLYHLFYRLTDADKGRCREGLRALHRHLPHLPQLRMRILSEALAA